MKHKHTLLPFALAATVAVTSAQANDEEWDGRFYIAPAVTYTGFDDGYNVDDDEGFHLSIGKPITSFLNAELQFSTVEAEDANASAEITGYGIDFLLFPMRGRLSPFALVGYMDSETEVTLGNQSADLDGDLLDLGVGLLYQVNDHGTAIRAEYRYRENDVDVAELEDNVFMLGLQFPLGAKSQPAAEAPPPPPPPPPAPAPAPEPEPEVLVELKGVHFAFDSHELTGEAKSILTQAVEAMNTRSGIDVVAVGHTDSTGPENYNLSLSQRRAKSVRDYLVSQGISGDRIATRGYGESSPIASNDTKDGRAQNRRVEVIVVDERLCLPPQAGDQTDANGCAVVK